MKDNAFSCPARHGNMRNDSYPRGYHHVNEIRTRILVSPDHRISGTVPDEVPAGEHEVTITVTDRSMQKPDGRQLDPGDLPSHDLGPWPEGLSLRREDMYGDDSR